MQNTKHESSLSAVIAGTRIATPVVEIKSYALAGDGMARVIVEVTHTHESRANPQVVAETLNKKLQGKMAAVAGTFHSLERSSFTERLTGIISVVRQAISVDGDMKGFRALAANMFMDDEQDMWVLRKTEAGQIMVKTTGIDDDMTLLNLLESVSSSSMSTSTSEFNRMTAQASSISSAAEAGDFVSYVTQDNLLSHGFVVAGVQDTDDLVVLSPGSEEGESIKRAAVTVIHNQAEFPAMEETKEEEVEQVVAAARGGIDLPFLLEYYKKVFSRSPAFYQQFADRLRKHSFC